MLDLLNYMNDPGSGRFQSTRPNLGVRFASAIGSKYTKAFGAGAKIGWAGVRGAASSFTPISPIKTPKLTEETVNRWLTTKAADYAEAADEHILTSAGKKVRPMRARFASLKGYGIKGLSHIPTGTLTKIARLGGFAAGMIGPLMVAYRLRTEVGGQNLGFFGGLSKTHRILGEEAAMGAGIGMGMAIGGMLGSVVGGPLGTVAGIAIGMGLGVAGSWMYNKTADVMEAPVRMAYRGFEYLRETGKRQRMLEMGGGISAANRTQQAVTMRQAALMEINRSVSNSRSILGREASMLHIR